MNRRRDLATVGVGGAAATAGCLTSLPFGGDQESERRAALRSVDSVPDDWPLAFAVELTTPNFHGEQTPELRLTVENRADHEVPVAYTPGKWDRAGFFSTMKSDPRGLVIAPAEEIGDRLPEQRNSRFTTYGHELTADAVHARTLESSAVEEWALTILGGADTVDATCPPANDDRFWAHVWPDEGETAIDGWGFTVSL